MDSQIAPEALVQMRGVRVEFPGVLALDGVDFALRGGEVHALMGENGAGKSTLIKVLTGVQAPFSGEIFLGDRLIRPRSPAEAAKLGIGAVYQEVNLVPTLTVAENIVLGRHPVRMGGVDWRECRRRAEAALARLDVHLDVGLRLDSCSIAIQQLAAIARALDAGSTRVLILDEPTSSLDRNEVARLFNVLRKLREDGVGIVLVTHFLEQMYQIADRITVLRNGRGVGTFETAELPRLLLVEKMLGREAPSAAPELHREKVGVGEPLLEAEGLTRRDLGPVSLKAGKGEVVGLAGLLGSGRTEIVRLLFGLDRAERGDVLVGGRSGRPTSPKQAMSRGLGYLPEDRKVEGIMPNLSVRENLLLAMQVRRGWLRRISRREATEVATRYIGALRIATPSPETPVGRLSGGNQQKVLLGRWLAAQPKVLILDEPTRGVDVGAKVEIERLMTELCGEGLAIILIGTDIEEVARDSHRLVVMRDRKKVGELTGDEIAIPRIMEMIASEAPNHA